MLRNPTKDCYTLCHAYRNYVLESPVSRKRIITPSDITLYTARNFINDPNILKKKIQLKITGLDFSIYNNMSSWAEGFLAAFSILFLPPDIKGYRICAVTHIDSQNVFFIDFYFDYSNYIV
jgi:hypothetical protein